MIDIDLAKLIVMGLKFLFIYKNFEICIIKIFFKSMIQAKRRI